MRNLCICYRIYMHHFFIRLDRVKPIGTSKFSRNYFEFTKRSADRKNIIANVRVAFGGFILHMRSQHPNYTQGHGEGQPQR